MEPNYETEGGLSNRSLESLVTDVNTRATSAPVSRPSLRVPTRRLTDSNAEADTHHAAASSAEATLRSENVLPTQRRSLLYRGMGSVVLTALAMVGRRAIAADATIAIDNFTFSPTPLTVARGTTVSWMNRDDIPHAIYCPALSLRSQPLETNDIFRHRFDQAGTFDYICSIHPNMRGRIICRVYEPQARPFSGLSGAERGERGLPIASPR